MILWGAAAHLFNRPSDPCFGWRHQSWLSMLHLRWKYEEVRLNVLFHNHPSTLMAFLQAHPNRSQIKQTKWKTQTAQQNLTHFFVTLGASNCFTSLVRAFTPCFSFLVCSLGCLKERYLNTQRPYWDWDVSQHQSMFQTLYHLLFWKRRLWKETCPCQISDFLCCPRWQITNPKWLTEIYLKYKVPN